MAKSTCCPIFLITSLTITLLGIGIMLLVLGIPHISNIRQTTCMVVQQNNVYESCATSCTGCDDSGLLGPGGPCVCIYVDYTDYVTWQYTVHNNSYTIQSQICSDGQNTYAQNYVTPCWYDHSNPKKASFISPTDGWVIVSIGICALCATIGTMIGGIIWYRRTRNEYAEL